jgi:hypothetical protein
LKQISRAGGGGSSSYGGESSGGGKKQLWAPKKQQPYVPEKPHIPDQTPNGTWGDYDDDDEDFEWY